MRIRSFLILATLISLGIIGIIYLAYIEIVSTDISVILITGIFAAIGLVIKLDSEKKKDMNEQTRKAIEERLKKESVKVEMAYKKVKGYLREKFVNEVDSALGNFQLHYTLDFRFGILDLITEFRNKNILFDNNKEDALFLKDLCDFDNHVIEIMGQHHDWAFNSQKKSYFFKGKRQVEILKEKFIDVINPKIERPESEYTGLDFEHVLTNLKPTEPYTGPDR